MRLTSVFLIGVCLIPSLDAQTTTYVRFAPYGDPHCGAGPREVLWGHAWCGGRCGDVHLSGVSRSIPVMLLVGNKPLEIPLAGPATCPLLVSPILTLPYPVPVRNTIPQTLTAFYLQAVWFQNGRLQFSNGLEVEDGKHAHACGQDVDLKAAELARARTLWKTICCVVEDTDPQKDKAGKRRVKIFLFQIAFHEGDRLQTRKQYKNGPARSFFQMEPHRAKLCCKLAREHKNGFFDRMASLCFPNKATIEKAEECLRIACAKLPDFGSPNATKWPAGSEIEKCLCKNDLFAAYLTRIGFKEIGPNMTTNYEIQSDRCGNAEYWADWWWRKYPQSLRSKPNKTALEKQQCKEWDDKVAKFKKNAEDADKHLVTMQVLTQDEAKSGKY